jgi:hypothetical protein
MKKNILNEKDMLNFAIKAVSRNGFSKIIGSMSMISEKEYWDNIEYFWETDKKKPLTHFDVTDNENNIIVRVYSCEEYGAAIVKPNNIVTTIEYDKETFLREMLISE